MIRTVTSSLDSPAATFCIGLTELLVDTDTLPSTTTTTSSPPVLHDDEITLANLAEVRSHPTHYKWNLKLPSGEEMQRELEAALPSSPSPLSLIVHAASSTARDYTPLQNMSEKMQGKLLILTGLVPGPISSTVSAAEKLAKDMVHKLKFGVPVVNSGTTSSKTQAATGGEMEVVEDESADTTIVPINERIGTAFLGLIDLDKQGDEPELVTSILLQALALASTEAGNVPILLTTQDAYGTKPWATQKATTTIETLLSHGASPQCLVLCRCPPRKDLEATYLDLLQRGIKLSFTFHGNLFYPLPNPEGQGEDTSTQTHTDGQGHLPEGGPSDEEGAHLLTTLCQKGYASQLLLSPGLCCRLQLTKYGGFGFAHLQKHVLPRLRRLGVSSTDINLMTSKAVLALFAWWTPPPVMKKPVEMGKCSWCGNMFEMRENEYYHKFAFIYCRRKCYNLHYDHGWKEVVNEG